MESGNQIVTKNSDKSNREQEIIIELASLPPEARLTIGEAAALMRVSRDTVRKQLEDGDLDYVFVGGSKRIPRWCIIESDREQIRQRRGQA